MFSLVSRDPINQHHVLVIPRAHHESFAELPPNVAAHLWSVAQGVSAGIRRVATPDGITHISEDDFGSGQLNLIRHYKLHIIPRFTDDGCSLKWHRPPDPGQAARSELARAIREHL